MWEKLILRVAVGPQSVLSHISCLRRMKCAGGMRLYKCSLYSDNQLTFSSSFLSPIAPTGLNVRNDQPGTRMKR